MARRLICRLSALLALAVAVGTGLGPISAWAKAGKLTEFTLSPPGNANPTFITAGPDGNLWFSLNAGHAIVRMTPNGVANVIPVPNPTVGGSQPEGITVGPDGNIWFADFKCGVGKSSLSGSVTEYAEPACGTPFGITAGPDGNLWFTDSSANSIGRVTPDGLFTMFPLGASTEGPTGITAGPDGALWFAANSGNAIGRIATDGNVTIFPLPEARVFPYAITKGADGALWFTELQPTPTGTFQLGRITQGGTITEFGVPHRTAWITSIGRFLWFTEDENNAVGRIRVDDRYFKEFLLPQPGSQPSAIAPGPGRRKAADAWFTELAGNRIGDITTR